MHFFGLHLVCLFDYSVSYNAWSQNLCICYYCSQELLEAVERERSFRLAPRNAPRFHHPTLGDFELQLPVGVDDAELEDRIIQHLAAAAAMGRTRGIGRREGSRSRSSAHARPQFFMFPPQPNGSSTGSGGEATDPAAGTENNQTAANNQGRQHMPSSVQSNQISASSSRSVVRPVAARVSNDNRF